jgi:cytochrome c-type biogenesis protein CcmE
MKPKNQRLILAGLALGAVAGAGLLAAVGLEDRAAFFYSPGDVAKNGLPAPGQAVRLGGMVADKSIQRETDGVTIRFIVKDNTKHSTPVRFTGIAPDLFKENSGVIAEGSFNADGSFTATNLLAKHDENYVPPELAGKMHKTGSVKP